MVVIHLKIIVIFKFHFLEVVLFIIMKIKRFFLRIQF